LWVKDGVAAGQMVSFATTGDTLNLGAQKFSSHIMDFGAAAR